MIPQTTWSPLHRDNFHIRRYNRFDSKSVNVYVIVEARRLAALWQLRGAINTDLG